MLKQISNPGTKLMPCIGIQVPPRAWTCGSAAPVSRLLPPTVAAGQVAAGVDREPRSGSRTWLGRRRPHKERRRRLPGRAAESSPDHAGSGVIRRRFTSSAGRAEGAGPGKNPFGMRRRAAFTLRPASAGPADLPGSPRRGCAHGLFSFSSLPRRRR